MNLKEQMKIPKTVQRKYRNERIRTSVKQSKRRKWKKSRIANILIEFIKNNIKEYMIITLIFLIGIFLGVMFVNNLEEEQKTEIKQQKPKKIRGGLEANFERRAKRRKPGKHEAVQNTRVPESLRPKARPTNNTRRPLRIRCRRYDAVLFNPAYSPSTSRSPCCFRRRYSIAEVTDS